MTRINEPHWGRPVGKVDAQGNVTISDQFANVMRALVKKLGLTTATAEAALAAAEAEDATPPISITGDGVSGSAETGYVITSNRAAVMARISLGF